MLRIALVLITCSVVTACMTETDRALWQETVQTVSGETSSVAAEAPAAAPKTAVQPQEIKTAKGKEKEKEKTVPSARANLPRAGKPN